MRNSHLLLLLGACTTTGDTDLKDTDETDTVETDTVDTDLDTDTTVRDSGFVGDTDRPIEPLPTDPCSDVLPEGQCPLGQVCLDGDCIYDLDPGTAKDDPETAWSELVAWASPIDLLPEAHPVDWATVDADVAAALADTTTAYGAAWEIVKGLGRLRNGHTYARPSVLCDVDPGWTSRESDSGACLIETDEGLVAYAVDEDTPWQVGDLLMSIGGRDSETLLADRLAQPRCRVGPPSDGGRRAEAISSLMFRQGSGGLVEVEGSDGFIRTFELPGFLPRLPCSGRIPAPTETAVVDGLMRADLADGVVLFHAPSFGVVTPSGFTAEPLLEALNTELAGLSPTTPVIFDIRGVQGGLSDMSDQLAQWMLTDDVPARSCSDRIGSAPGDISGPNTTSLQPDPDFVHAGPVAVLVDEATYGAPEYLPLTLSQANRGLIIGRPSYASYGLTWFYEAHPELGASIDGRRCDDAAGDALENRPVQLDLEVIPTRADIIAGVDSVVESARAELASP